MSVCRTVSEILSVKEWRDLKIGGRGRLRSLKMASSDRSYTTFYWSAIVVSFSSYFTLNNHDLEKVTEGHPNRYHAVSYSPSIVNMAVCSTVYEIFSSKYSMTLKNWVRGCARSLKTAPFDRSYATFYWSAVVNI